MEVFSSKTLVLLHLYLLLLSTLNLVVGSDDHGNSVVFNSIAQTLAQPPAQAPEYHHHPGHAPAQPPSHAPVQPPSHAPGQAPSRAPGQAPSRAPSTMPPRKFVAVQGVVYCKDCQHVGTDNLAGAKPLSGALVGLQCNNTRMPLVLLAKTYKNRPQM